MLPVNRSAPLAARNRWLLICLFLAAGALLAWQLSALSRGLAFRAWPAMSHEMRHGLIVLTFANPWFYIGTVVILLLEKLFPVRREQPLLSVSLAQDFVWLFLESLFSATVLVGFAALLRLLYRKYLGFLTIDAVTRLPEWGRIVVAVLAIDFLGWFHHWLRHKVRPFWYFHCVHHSQRHLNLFTDLRYHVVEYIIANAVKVVPLAMLQVKNPAILAYVLAHQWYTRFYHGNIRTNLGVLRYVLVTPQSHRVHHSPHRRHWDRNFGVIFSIWDWIFGTQYPKGDEFPRTGIPNRDFPHETSARPLALLWTPIAQMIWPFTKLFSREAWKISTSGSSGDRFPSPPSPPRRLGAR